MLRTSGVQHLTIRCLAVLAPVTTRMKLQRVVESLVKEGQFAECWRVLAEAKDAGVQPDNSIFTRILQGLLRQGHVSEALDVLRHRMPGNGVRPDVRAYTPVLRGLVARGDLDEAHTLMKNMETQGVAVDTVAYSVLLRGFLRSGDGAAAESLQAHMKEYGLEADELVYRTLLASHVRKGSLDDAISVVQQAYAEHVDMRSSVLHTVRTLASRPQSGVSHAAWTFVKGVLAGLAGKDGESLVQAGVLDTLCKLLVRRQELAIARMVLEEMVDRGQEPAPWLCGEVMEGLVKQRDVSGAKRLMSFVREPSSLMWYAMIRGLTKAGDVQAAEDMMRDMHARGMKVTIKIYSVLINGYLRQGNIPKARALKSDMESQGIVPDAYVFAALFKGILNLEGPSGAYAVLEEMMEYDIKPSDMVYKDLIKWYIGRGKVSDALNVVARMQRDGVAPDNSTVNIIVSGLLPKDHEGDLVSAKALVKQLAVRGVVISADSFDNLCRRLIAKGDREGAYAVLQDMISQHIRPVVRTCTEVINWLVEKGDMAGAQELAECLDEPDAYACCILMKGLVREEKLDEAYKTMERMEARGVPRSSVMYASLVQGFVQRGDVHGAKRMFREMAFFNIIPNSFAYGAVLKGYVDQCDLRGAFDFMEQLKADGMTLKTVAYNILLDGLARQGMKEGVKDVLHEMTARGVPRDEITYNTLVARLVERGDFEEAKCLVHDLPRTYAAAPSLLLKGLALRGHIDEAREVMQTLLSNGVPPTAASCSAFITGLVRRSDAGDVDEARHLLREVTQQGITPKCPAPIMAQLQEHDA